MGETGAALYPFGLPEINMLEQILRQLASIVISEMFESPSQKCRVSRARMVIIFNATSILLIITLSLFV